MTKQEAIEQMKQGKKLTHRSFSNNEFITSDKTGLYYTFEDGVRCCFPEFWKWRLSESWSEGWEIFKSEQQNPSQDASN